MRYRRLLFLVLLSSCANAGPSAAPFSLRISANQTYTFRPVTPGGIGLDALYGKYERPMALLSGTSLNLYPNKHFTVVRWCDVCRDQVLAEGTYTYSDNTLAFQYSNRRGKGDELDFPIRLTTFHGSMEQKDYSEGSEFILISPDKLAAARKNRDFREYLQLKTWYPDWQSMHEHEAAALQKR
jgi:hypothetical protein